MYDALFVMFVPLVIVYKFIFLELCVSLSQRVGNQYIILNEIKENHYRLMCDYAGVSVYMMGFSAKKK